MNRELSANFDTSQQSQTKRHDPGYRLHDSVLPDFPMDPLTIIRPSGGPFKIEAG
jgi:hypothetical protein